MRKRMSWLMCEFVAVSAMSSYMLLENLKRRVDEILMVFTTMSVVWIFISAIGVLTTPKPDGWWWLGGILMSVMGLVISEHFRFHFRVMIATLVDREITHMQVAPSGQQQK